MYFIADRSCKDSTDARIFLNKDLKKQQQQQSESALRSDVKLSYPSIFFM